MRTLPTAVAAAAIASAVAFVAPAGVAQAQTSTVGTSGHRVTPDGLGGRHYHYTLKSKKKLSSDYINKKQKIGSCTILTKGATCTITSGMQASRTVSVALGASRGAISGELGISSAKWQSVTVGCTSPKMAKNKRWVAYPKGSHYRYKIHLYVTQSGSDGMPYDGGTSGWKYAFNPSKTGIACGLG